MFPEKSSFSLVEERERNIGVGIEFEMQFGDWPGRSPQKQD